MCYHHRQLFNVVMINKAANQVASFSNFISFVWAACKGQRSIDESQLFLQPSTTNIILDQLYGCSLILLTYSIYQPMELLEEIQRFYKDNHVQKGHDHRSEEEKRQQSEYICKISERNLSAFKISLTPKKNVKYEASPLKKMDLGEGVYCYITDNQVQSPQTILAIHGAPGSCQEWAGLQSQIGKRYRWINFAVPGMDGEDERRGTYEGDFAGICQLIQKLAKALSLRRLVICGHSYGSSIARNVAERFPNLVQGLINLAGITILWGLGMTTLYKMIVGDNKYYEESWKSKRLYQIDEERDKLYQKFVDQYKQKKYGLYGIPFFKKIEFMTFLKLNLYPPSRVDTACTNYRTLGILRLSIYGKSDPILQTQRAEATLYDYLTNKDAYPQKSQIQSLLKAAKPRLDEQLQELGVKIGDDLPSYFCFMLDNTGHAIHRRRPEQIGKIIPIYMGTLQVLHQQKYLSRSRL